MAPTCTTADLQRLTGLKRQHAIRRFLEKRSIPFFEGADGWPRVLESVMLERMGATPERINPEPRLRLRNG